MEKRLCVVVVRLRIVYAGVWLAVYVQVNFPSFKLLAMSWVSLAFITLSFVNGENRSGKDGNLELPYFSSCFCRPLDTSQFVQLV